MKLSEIKCGNEVLYQGAPHIAIKDSRRTGTKGEAATLATVMLTPTAQAGVYDDGTLEFGTHGYSARDVPDIDVPVLRTGMRFRSSCWRSETTEDGRVIPVDTGYTTAEASRSELMRWTLRRRETQVAADEYEGMFRRAMQRALGDGLSVPEVQEVTKLGGTDKGLSRARVYQIRDDRR